MRIAVRHVGKNKWLRLTLSCLIVNAVTAIFVCGYWWMQCKNWKSCHDLAAVNPETFFVLSALAIVTLALNGLLAVGGTLSLVKALAATERAD